MQFAQSESTALTLEPREPTDVSTEDPAPVRPPLVHLVEFPQDHILGASTQATFEVVQGDYPLSEIECFVDQTLLDCEFSQNQVVLENFQMGEHQFSVVVYDTEGLNSRDQASWRIFDRFLEKSTSVNVESWSDEVDILFVIDNSGSMQEEQLGIANKINNFFAKLNDLDWRVGIITTDPYERDLITGEANPLADGVLLPFPNQKYFIDSSLSLLEAKNLFSQTIFRPETGNGHERGIYNTYRSIERALNPVNTVNQRLHDFYRARAAFSVVLISDENETTLNGVGNPLGDLDKSQGQNLVNFVKQTWGNQKLFQYNSVIVRPGEDSCISTNEKFGVTYQQLSLLTGGLVESICADDYSGALKDIGSHVANLQKRYALDCVPQDIDLDGKVDLEVIAKNGKPVPTYTISQDQIEFSKPLSEGDYDFNYYCPNTVIE